MAPQRPGEFGGPGSVVGVRVLVDPLRVVQHGEQPDHIDDRTRLLGQAKPVLVDPCPVSNAVMAAPGEGVIFEDGMRIRGMLIGMTRSPNRVDWGTWRLQ